jgi:hypothetical protein
MRLVDDEFIDAMHGCFYLGVEEHGRVQWDWKRLKWDSNTQLLYTAKLLGHVAKGIRAETAEERRKHLAAVACNANILWHHQRE